MMRATVGGTGTSAQLSWMLDCYLVAGSLSHLLLEAGTAVRSDQVAQGFVQSHLGNSPGLETALLWATCSTAGLS